jgi:two-component system chemotaxis response regulator CheB
VKTRVAVAWAGAGEAALRESLERDGDITVTAGIPAVTAARAAESADVLVVDMESGGAAALDLIAEVMAVGPMPILALCPDDGGAPTAMEVLLHGAVESVPTSAVHESGGRLLRQTVRVVSGVRVIRRRRPSGPPRPPPLTARRRAVVAMAASTGGPAVLVEVLGAVPQLPVPVLLVQHLHDTFVATFVSWLGGYSPLPVSQAVAGHALRPGHVYVAPAGQHMLLGDDGTVVLTVEPASVHRPSADVLFASVAKVAGPAAVGVLLTGMGSDGAAGLLAMRRAGAFTVVQDEASSTVFGMPKAALESGAASMSLPPAGIAQVIRAAIGRLTR